MTRGGPDPVMPGRSPLPRDNLEREEDTGEVPGAFGLGELRPDEVVVDLKVKLIYTVY